MFDPIVVKIKVKVDTWTVHAWISLLNGKFIKIAAMTILSAQRRDKIHNLHCWCELGQKFIAKALLNLYILPCFKT